MSIFPVFHALKDCGFCAGLQNRKNAYLTNNSVGVRLILLTKKNRSRQHRDRFQSKRSLAPIMTQKPPNTLCNAVREHLIHSNDTNTALVLDALYTFNCTIGKLYSVAEIVAITSSMGISEKVIRSGLKHSVFRTELESTAGRSRVLYRLPSPRQVRDFLMVFDVSGHADRLPVASFSSASYYKAHLHAAMLARLTVDNGGWFQMARATMAKRLSVTIDTIRRYEKMFEIVVQAHITAHELHGGIFWDLPAKHDGSRNAWLCIQKADGTEENYPLVRAIAAQAKALGCRVFKVIQHSNLYEFVGDCTPYLQHGYPYRQPTQHLT